MLDQVVKDVRYRPLPGWPRHRVGDDRSVWVREDRAGFSDATPRRPSSYRGERHHRAKLTEPAVAEARRLYAEGWTWQSLADRYRVEPWTMWYAVSGRTWRHVPMPDVPIKPRWRALVPIERPGENPAVVLTDETGKTHRRAVELLYRAAFEPASLPPLWLARVPPRPPRRQPTIVPRELRPPLPPSPAPPPAIAPVAAQVVAEVLDELVPIEARAPIVDDIDDEPGPRRGGRHGRAKWSDDDVREARRLHSDGWSYKRLCERYGIGRVTLHYALVGKTFAHVKGGGNR
jgi:hypothetical protein